MADKKISELTEETTPADGDLVAGVDIGGGITKKFTWTVLKAFLKTYFDTLYNNYVLSKAAVESVLTGVITTHSHGASAGTLPITRIYIASGSPYTWSKPAGLTGITVEIQAPGGGACSVSSSSGGQRAGAGAGGYCKKTIAVGALGATETVTVGAYGAGGTGAASNGNNGGNCSFGAHCSANGGVASVTSSDYGGNGGTATGGDINIPGQNGCSIFNSPDPGHGGYGGNAMIGHGGGGGFNTDGQAGQGYGGGGGGPSDTNSASRAGGNGAPGIIIVTEYY